MPQIQNCVPLTILTIHHKLQEKLRMVAEKNTKLTTKATGKQQNKKTQNQKSNLL